MLAQHFRMTRPIHTRQDSRFVWVSVSAATRGWPSHGPDHLGSLSEVPLGTSIHSFVSSKTETFQNSSRNKRCKGGSMKSESVSLLTLAVLLISSAAQSGGQERQKPATLALDKLELHNVKAEPVTYLGRRAMRVSDAGPEGLDDAGRLAVVRGSSFQDGTIEVNLSGDTAPEAPANLRGFVGVAFRITADRSHFECFYLRPKNGRAEDQLQRNHSVQYISIPGFGWQKLRSDTPG